LDVGGASILEFVTFSSPIGATFSVSNIDITGFQQATLAAGQFFGAAEGGGLSNPAVPGVAAQASTIGPATVTHGTELIFAGSDDNFTLKANTPVTVALFALEEETRPAGVIYPGFTGKPRASLDVIEATSEFSAASNTLTFTALMSGPIKDGQDNVYAFGVNRGGATVAPFPQEANVQFNAVLNAEVLPSGATQAFLRLIPGSTNPIAANIRVDGAKISVAVPASALPSLGAAPSSYLTNLWTLSMVGGPPTQIQKFIPDNALAKVLPGNELATP
jgi:hypothetical protein